MTRFGVIIREVIERLNNNNDEIISNHISNIEMWMETVKQCKVDENYVCTSAASDGNLNLTENIKFIPSMFTNTNDQKQHLDLFLET